MKFRDTFLYSESCQIQWNHPFCSISKIGGSLFFSVEPPKNPIFSTQLIFSTQHIFYAKIFTNKNIFSKGFLHVLFRSFFSTLYNKNVEF